MHLKYFYIWKNNFKNIAIIFFIFLISLLSGTIAYPLFKSDYRVIAILMWITYAISTSLLFFVTYFLLIFPNAFYLRPTTNKFWMCLFITTSAFILYTIVFIIFKYISCLYILSFMSLPSIILALVSVIVLGLGIAIKK